MLGAFNSGCGCLIPHPSLRGLKLQAGTCCLKQLLALPTDFSEEEKLEERSKWEALYFDLASEVLSAVLPETPRQTTVLRARPLLIKFCRNFRFTDVVNH